MRQFDPATAAYFAAARATGFRARILIWVRARNRDTGEVEALGLWNGRRARLFSIGGEVRLYSGAGGAVSVDPIIYAKGLDVRMQRARLTPIDDAVAQLIRGYDARHAPIEIHRALYHPESGALVAEPHRVFSGTIDQAPIRTGELGGETMVDCSMASGARALTRTLPLKRSDESQRLRDGDRIFKYADLSGRITDYWGDGGPDGAYTIKGPAPKPVWNAQSER